MDTPGRSVLVAFNVRLSGFATGGCVKIMPSFNNLCQESEESSFVRLVVVVVVFQWGDNDVLQ